MAPAESEEVGDAEPVWRVRSDGYLINVNYLGEGRVIHSDWPPLFGRLHMMSKVMSFPDIFGTYANDIMTEALRQFGAAPSEARAVSHLALFMTTLRQYGASSELYSVTQLLGFIDYQQLPGAVRSGS